MLSGYEPLFLSHTRSLLEHSLAHVDKLVHYMWASVILVSYYMRVGRVRGTQRHLHHCISCCRGGHPRECPNG